MLPLNDRSERTPGVDLFILFFHQAKVASNTRCFFIIHNSFGPMIAP